MQFHHRLTAHRTDRLLEHKHVKDTGKEWNSQSSWLLGSLDFVYRNSQPLLKTITQGAQ